MSSLATLNPRALSRGPRALGPWTPEDLIRLLVVDGLGIGLCLTGWYQCRYTASVPTQLTWLAVGVAGIIVAGAGNGIWLLRGRLTIALARAEVLPDAPCEFVTAPAVPLESLVHATEESMFVAAPSMSKYHLAGCPAVEGRVVGSDRREAHEALGLAPCGVCEP